MKKYPLIFNYLKKKVGPDCARLITYEAYCDDLQKLWRPICKLDGFDRMCKSHNRDFRDLWIHMNIYLFKPNYRIFERYEIMYNTDDVYRQYFIW